MQKIWSTAMVRDNGDRTFEILRHGVLLVFGQERGRS